MQTLRLPPGTLLAAWPGLPDPNFRETVVLLCHHDAEGSFGLVLNRPTSLTTTDLLSEHQDLSRIPFPIHLGGPVDSTRLHFVHDVPLEIGGGRELDEHLVLGGDLDDLARYLAAERTNAAEHVRIFVGYSGWGAHQLEAEIEGRSWMPGRATPRRVFSATPAGLWRDVVQRASKRIEGLDGGTPGPGDRSN